MVVLKASGKTPFSLSQAQFVKRLCLKFLYMFVCLCNFFSNMEFKSEKKKKKFQGNIA